MAKRFRADPAARRAPAEVARAIDDLLAGTPAELVHIGARDFAEAFAHAPNGPLAAAVNAIGDPQVYLDAVRRDGELAIPTGRYLNEVAMGGGGDVPPRKVQRNDRSTVDSRFSGDGNRGHAGGNSGVSAKGSVHSARGGGPAGSVAKSSRESLTDMRKRVNGNIDLLKTDPDLIKLLPHEKFFVAGGEARFKFPKSDRILKFHPDKFREASMPIEENVSISIMNKFGEEFDVEYQYGFANLDVYSDPVYTKLELNGVGWRGEEWVKISRNPETEIQSARRSLARKMKISEAELLRMENQLLLVWQHTINFSGPLYSDNIDNLGMVRMLLVPRRYHDVRFKGANHTGGRAIIDFHQKHKIP
jgi:hypothetical protein